ncbi:TetR family transcriptional regulator [Paenibacillus albidus]|uniref:TetR family transcriptional regulator n=1 Tax=Paenibacillus albidus TaxID=2041023 RepID=A0A917CFR3_9BACL|nr:TetR/AcrR family transcriptional regulator [Paenibacillus albidus]GGF87132.1 TetR family transcriptional regulator [Paenibacillus albidus]
MADRTIDKREQIIKTAMQLFAVKGSSSTSMQDIAELCGISKGSLYLAFKSKEELEHSIFIYCYRMIRDPLIREEQESNRSPREKLRNQTEILLNHVYELREFLQRQIQELAGKGQTDIPKWLCKSNGILLSWFKSKLETLYGPEILPYTGDLSLVVHGMIHSYLRVIFQLDSPVSIARMADHLLDLMDILVSGLLAGSSQPLISPAVLASWMEEHEENLRRNPLQLIKEMRTIVSAAANLEPEQLEDALESLTILDGELLDPHPRRAIIQGMLSNLESHSALEKHLQELKKLIMSFGSNPCTLS